MPVGAYAGLLPGYVTLTQGHTDIAIDYDTTNGFHLGVGRDNDIPPALYEANGALMVAGINTETTQPAGAQYDFIGAGTGNEIWLMPQQQEADKLFLGFGAEDIAPGTFASWTPPGEPAGEWLQIDLKGVTGPGQFAIWQSDAFGNPINELSTADSLDTIYHLSGAHQHYNWAFSAPGNYEVNFQVTAYLGPNQTSPVSSDIATYYFQVVPEPSSVGLALLAGAACCVAGLARRCRRA